MSDLARNVSKRLLIAHPLPLWERDRGEGAPQRGRCIENSHAEPPPHPTLSHEGRRARAAIIRSYAATFASVAAIILLSLHPALAQKPRDTYTADDLAKVEAARDAALKRLHTLETASRTAAREVSDIDIDLLIAASDASRREEAANAAEERLMLLSSDIDTARGRLTRDEAALEDLLAALMTFGSRRPPALAASPEDAGAAVRAAILMGETAPALSRRAAEFKLQIEDLNRLTEQTRREREIITAEEAALGARRQEIEALAAEKRLSSSSLAAETRALRSEADRLGREAETLRDLLEGLAKAAPAAPGLKPAPKPPPQAPAASTAKPGAPPASPSASARTAPAAVAGAPLAPAVGNRLRRFGEEVNGGRQEGATFATRSGAQVIAPLDARVQYAGVFRTYGLMAILDVGNGVLVVLSGPDALYVEAGQWVLAGEPIGRMAVQKSPSPELYLEVRRNGQPIDPEKWLRRGA
jgi:murein hydrolase activator